MDATAPVELAPHYYRDNFLRLLDTVERNYEDLLAPAEQAFVSAYRALAFDAQCLYVRLISRVGPWFREEQLDYPELNALPAAVEALLRAGLLAETNVLSVAETGSLFSRQSLAQAMGLDHKLRKAELLAALPEDEPIPVALFTAGRVIGPVGADIVEVLSLLFFGNRHQGLTDFVLSDLGVARHYPYTVDRSQRLFCDRGALDEYLGCAAIADAWWALREGAIDAIDLPSLAALALDFSPSYSSSLRRYARLCNSLARDLERAGEGEAALALYARSDLHPARERSARIHERAERYGQAAEICETIIEQPWGEEERDAAQRIMPRLQRALTGASQRRPRDNFARIELALTRDNQSVELLAANALAADWPDVYYVENQLMNSLFGLAFWEQIFAPLPGAFHHPFQSVPADMYEQGFAERREALLAARLDDLATTDLSAELSAAWCRYQGYQCRWVNWRYVDEQLVTRAASIIPREHLLAIWRRMLFDPGENRRGFPDLLALGESPGQYCMIEVKAPGDTLQDSQKRWLRFFASHDIPAQVAWVTWNHD